MVMGAVERESEKGVSVLWVGVVGVGTKALRSCVGGESCLGSAVVFSGLGALAAIGRQHCQQLHLAGPQMSADGGSVGWCRSP